MKNLRFLLLIFIVGCEPQVYWEFKIENETTYNITIEGYDRLNLYNEIIDGYQNDKETINILPNSSYSIFKQMGYHPDDFGIFDNVSIDSVNVIFNDEKILVQFCDFITLRDCEFDRNIAGYETEYEKVKTGRSSGEKEYRFTYTITEEDYTRAVPIEN